MFSVTNAIKRETFEELLGMIITRQSGHSDHPLNRHGISITHAHIIALDTSFALVRTFHRLFIESRSFKASLSVCL